MTTTEMTAAQASDATRNGVDTATLFATLDAVKQATRGGQVPVPRPQSVGQRHPQPHDHRGYFGVGEERTHERTFVFDADHPAVLVGQDHGPTPAEFVLHALAACLTAGLANIAAARGVTLTEVSLDGRRATLTSTVSSGSSAEVRNGYQQITVRFRLRATHPEKLREIVEQSRRRSTDVITNGAPVSIDVDAG